MNIKIIRDFGNGVYLNEEQAINCRNKIVEVLKTELPKEIQTIGVIDFICKDVMEHVKSKTINL